MTVFTSRPARRATTVAAVVVVAASSLVGCSGDSGDDPLDDGDPTTPVDEDPVVPDEGDLEPVDNLDEDVNEGGIGNPQEDVDNDQPAQQDG